MGFGDYIGVEHWRYGVLPGVEFGGVTRGGTTADGDGLGVGGCVSVGTDVSVAVTLAVMVAVMLGVSVGVLDSVGEGENSGV